MHNLSIFDMTRIDDGEINVAQEGYLIIVKVGVTSDGVAFAIPRKAQAMIAGRRQADEIEAMGAYLKLLLRNFMHNNLVRGLLQATGSKYLQQAIDDLLSTRWPINMNICRARVSLRPCSCLQKWDDIRDMIGVEVREHDMLQLVVPDAGLQQPLHNTMATVEEHIHAL